MRQRGGGVAGWPGRSTTSRSCWRRLDGSWNRLGNGSPDRSPTVRLGRSVCTTPTPGRSGKGRLGKPVEFGHKAQLVDNDEGIVLDHDVQPGNPPDGPRLKPAVEGVIRRTRRKPRTVTADRGYGEAGIEDELHDLGVRNVVIPRKGRPSKARQAQERQPAFRRHLKWRTGCEGRISHLKRNYGWSRTMIDTTEGARIWTGHGVWAHNLTKIATLTV